MSTHRHTPSTHTLTYLRTYISIYTCTHAHRHIRTACQPDTDARPCAKRHTHMYTQHTYVHTHTHTCTYTCARMCACECIGVRLCRCVFTCGPISTEMYRLTYIRKCQAYDRNSQVMILCSVCDGNDV